MEESGDSDQQQPDSPQRLAIHNRGSNMMNAPTQPQQPTSAPLPIVPSLSSLSLPEQLLLLNASLALAANPVAAPPQGLSPNALLQSLLQYSGASAPLQQATSSTDIPTGTRAAMSSAGAIHNTSASLMGGNTSSNLGAMNTTAAVRSTLNASARTTNPQRFVTSSSSETSNGGRGATNGSTAGTDLDTRPGRQDPQPSMHDVLQRNLAIEYHRVLQQQQAPVTNSQRLAALLLDSVHGGSSNAPPAPPQVSIPQSALSASVPQPGVPVASTASAAAVPTPSVAPTSSHAARSRAFRGNPAAAEDSSVSDPALPKPKRPRTAYNLYFKEQRAKILEHRETQYTVDETDWKKRKGRSKPHGKITFQELGKMIGSSWKELEPEARSKYEEKAARDKARYKAEMDEFLRGKQNKLEARRAALEATVPEKTKQQYFGS